MKKYGKAWETLDSDLILECFTKGGVYQESPLGNKYRGHKQIKKFWGLISKNTKNVKFKLGKCYVSGTTGFAEWECRNTWRGKRHHMAGIMILKMRGNRITHLNEYWNTN